MKPLAKCELPTPACLCPVSTPWESRRIDEPLVIEATIVLYSRTCLKCCATTSVEPRHARREDRLAAIKMLSARAVSSR